MKKNVAIVVLGAVAMVLTVLVWFQGQQIAALKEQQQKMLELEREVAKAAPGPVAEAPAPAPTVEAKPAEPLAVAAPVATAASTNSPFAGMAQMMKSPQMKEMMRAQQKVTIDRMYGSLNKYLDISTNDMEALKELLLQRQMALMDASMSAMSGSDADRKQALDDAKTVKTDYDKQIQDLLGTQAYPAFQDYEKTAGDRVSLEMFKSSLPTELVLTDQQEESLLTAMAEERKALPTTSALNNQTPDPSKFTEQGMADTLKQMDQLQQRYTDRAASILTPSQLEQFTKFEQQMNSMAAVGMKMAAQMFGNKNTTPAPAAATAP